MLYICIIMLVVLLANSTHGCQSKILTSLYFDKIIRKESNNIAAYAEITTNEDGSSYRSCIHLESKNRKDVTKIPKLFFPDPLSALAIHPSENLLALCLEINTLDNGTTQKGHTHIYRFWPHSIHLIADGYSPNFNKVTILNDKEVQGETAEGSIYVGKSDDNLNITFSPLTQ